MKSKISYLEEEVLIKKIYSNVQNNFYRIISFNSKFSKFNGRLTGITSYVGDDKGRYFLLEYDAEGKMIEMEEIGLVEDTVVNVKASLL